jgi:hypothetical protein
VVVDDNGAGDGAGGLPGGVGLNAIQPGWVGADVVEGGEVDLGAGEGGEGGVEVVERKGAAGSGDDGVVDFGLGVCELGADV